ncbi:hypothetical protein Lalb_Chr21g0306311 [Lupinus albus]|uniref:Uncharacterized protein n=1 Tax=Lupinus albus TaxID=3870 RepID=A0A6A4NID6_LUPAL|nr:hypothetical protein Lalb_Chr21g0306311 [Lupinus albus]
MRVVQDNTRTCLGETKHPSHDIIKRRKVITNDKPNEEQVTSIYKALPFKEIHVYLEHVGTKTLEIISSYNYKRNLCKVRVNSLVCASN